MNNHYTLIANNRTGTIQLQKNVARLNLPKTEAEIKYSEANGIYFLAEGMSQKNPHLSKYLWNAAGIVAGNGARFATAEEVEAGTIDQSDEAHHLIPKITRPIAFVNGSDPETPYTVYKIQWFAPAVGGPEPDYKHVLGCTCPHYTKGNGRRPTIREGSQPVCKHILAALMQRRYIDEVGAAEEAKAKAIKAHEAMIERYRDAKLDQLDREENKVISRSNGYNNQQKREMALYRNAEGAHKYAMKTLANGGSLDDLPSHVTRRLGNSLQAHKKTDSPNPHIMNDPIF